VVKNLDLSESASGFPHAMLAEIFQQPQALRDTLDYYLRDKSLSGEAFAAAHSALLGHERLVIAASGSSRHAGLAGEIMLEDLAGVTVDVEYASEYTYRSTHTLQDPCTIVISQSGETADTLAALREARGRGLKTIAITNNPSSAMAREADASMPTMAGKERAIPATKSFTTQLAVLYLLTVFAARMRGRATARVTELYLEQLIRLPDLLEQAIPRLRSEVATVAKRLKETETFLFLGRGIHYAIAREGALKLKESSYMQAEGYPAGELKHGPNALVSGNAALVVLAAYDRNDPDSTLRHSKILQLLRDLKKQGADTLTIATEADDEVAELSSDCIFVPACSEYLLPVCEVVPLQLLAYSIAVLRGIDVDNPRNLVKAVVRE
jgi:glucosamine--fructose-6-phosphate aminotransferase (isomerizing)